VSGYGRRVLPAILVGIDPDSVRTALAAACLVAPATYALWMLEGGGSSRTAVAWSSVSGQLALLREYQEHAKTLTARSESSPLVRVAVETQAAHSPWSVSVEPLRRVRYHLDAACELLDIEIEHVDKAAWENFIAPGVRGEGAIKRAYRDHANRLLPSHTLNEDTAAAFCILLHSVAVRFGATLIVD
jgi:hypothetical protein